MSVLPADAARAARFLQPGHLVISAQPMEITTILGSCVAVCLWDMTRRIGGMNHFMLPHFGGACMFAQMSSASHLGQKNAELALDFLSRNGIEVVEANTGGNRGRKLTYRTDEGTVCLKSI